MRLLAKLISFLLAASLIRAQTEVPTPDPTDAPQGNEETITAQVASNAVSLAWVANEEAEQYMVKIKPLSVYYEESHDPADILTSTTSDTTLLVGNLKANTLYSCTVALADSNGTVFYNDYAYITFKTLLPKVTNLKVHYAGENFVEIVWDANEHASDYSIVVKDQNHNPIHASIDSIDSKATISGLEPVNYYFVYVIVVGPENEQGDTAVIQVRTDGQGVKVHLWEGHDGDIHGGQVAIFRPMKVPPGPYPIKVNFNCALASVKIWNAKFIPEGSDLKTGMVYMEQRKQWQKEKSLIGIIFYLDMYSEHFDHCEITNTSVTALFGDEANSASGIEAMPTENTDCPVEWYEWRTTKTKATESAGFIKIALHKIYNDTSVPHEEAKYPKPVDGHFIIAVDSGEGCPGGITVQRPWSMTQKSKEGMVGATPQMNYFVQNSDQWYSNEPGLIYGYDPETCPDRSGIAAQVMINGPFVQAVQLAADIVPESP